MTDFELIVLGFFMGVFFSLIMIMAGVIYDTRINRGERKGDSNMRIYIPKRSSNRGSYNRRDKPVGSSKKEMITVLTECQRYACKYEGRVLNDVIRLVIQKGEENG